MLNPHSKVYTPEIFSCLVCRMAFRTKLVPVQEVDCKNPVQNNRITLYHIVRLEYQGVACLQKSVYRCVGVPSNSTIDVLGINDTLMHSFPNAPPLHLQAPHDSLDFVLKCQYNHHEQFMDSKAEVLKQPETVGLPHGYVRMHVEPC